MSKAISKTATAVGILTFGTVASLAIAGIFSRTINFEDVEPGQDPQQGWTFGVSPQNERIATIDDNHYLMADIDNWGVTLRSKTDGSNLWVGNKNYRDEGVVGFQMTVAGTADTDTARALTMFILTDNGTPNDTFDDFGYYRTLDNKWYGFLGKPQTYQFLIPSWVEGDEPPRGWIPYAVNDQIPDDISWDKVITDVDRLDIGLWRPGFFYIFQFHHMGVDNLKLFIDSERRK